MWAEDNKDGRVWEGGVEEMTEESSVRGTGEALQQCNECREQLA